MSNYSDHSGWSSENSPVGGNGSSWGGSGGPDGSKSGNSGTSGYGGRQAANSSRYAVADLRLVKPGYPAPTFPIGGTINATVCTNVPENTFMNWGSYIDNAKPMAARLAGAAVRGTPLGRIGSFLMGLEEGRKEKAAQLQQQMIDKAKEGAARVNVTDVFHVTALPMAAIIATPPPMESIREQGKVLADVVSQPVVDTKNGQRQIAITREPTEVSVVKAEKTSKPNVYSAQVVAGMKPMQITVNNSIPSSQLNKNQVNTASEVGIFTPTAAGDTHHAILDFDGKHEPIYISVSKVPTEAEKKAQLEEAKKREQEWATANPLLAAELELSEAQQEFASIDKTYQEKQNYLNQLLNTPEGLAIADPVNNPLVHNNVREATGVNNFDIKIDSPALLNAALFSDEGQSFFDEVSELLATRISGRIKPSIAEGIVNAYLYLRSELLDTYDKIEAAKEALAPVMEARKKAENKKKEKEEKAKKESKRNQPGTATGKGEPVGDKWLHDAGKENGAPIPDRIADKLRGKKFKDFNDFREKFWEEVSKDPELLKQFNKGNQTIIKKGRAPYVPKGEEVGGREVNEIHHVKPISEDGGVYDMDNLRITTPKRHIEIHRGKK